MKELVCLFDYGKGVDACDICVKLNNFMEEYGKVTLADVLILAGGTPKVTDWYIGWTGSERIFEMSVGPEGIAILAPKPWNISPGRCGVSTKEDKRMAKVYVVTCEFAIFTSYEDYAHGMNVVGVCSSEEAAKKMVQDDMEKGIIKAQKLNAEYNSEHSHSYEMICDRNPEGDADLYLDWTPFEHGSYSYFIKEYDVVNK